MRRGREGLGVWNGGQGQAGRVAMQQCSIHVAMQCIRQPVRVSRQLRQTPRHSSHPPAAQLTLQMPKRLLNLVTSQRIIYNKEHEEVECLPQQQRLEPQRNGSCRLRQQWTKPQDSSASSASHSGRRSNRHD